MTDILQHWRGGFPKFSTSIRAISSSSVRKWQRINLWFFYMQSRHAIALHCHRGLTLSQQKGGAYCEIQSTFFYIPLPPNPAKAFASRCEVITGKCYLVQSVKISKKKKDIPGWWPAIAFLYLFLFILFFVLHSFFLNTKIRTVHVSERSPEQVSCRSCYVSVLIFLVDSRHETQNVFTQYCSCHASGLPNDNTVHKKELNFFVRRLHKTWAERMEAKISPQGEVRALNEPALCENVHWILVNEVMRIGCIA